MDNIRLVLFVALTAILFLLWQAWRHDYGPVSAPPVPAAASTSKPALEPSHDLPIPPVAAPAAASTPPEAFNTLERIHVSTDLLRAELDTQGGDLRRLFLLHYPVAVDKPKEPFELFADTPPRIFIAQSGLLSSAQAPTHHAVFSATRDHYVLAPGQDVLDVPLTWKAATGLTVTKTYIFHRNSYLIDVRYDVENATGEPWTGRLYGQFQRTPPASKSRFARTYTGGVLHSKEKRYEKIDFARMKKEPVQNDAVGGWAAMIQHYFGAAWIPDQQATNHYYAKALDADRYAIGVVTPPVAIAPASRGTLDLTLYAGPAEQQRLAKAAPGLQLLVDYGYLTIIAEPLYWLLRHIHAIVGNWGWAIVLLTVLIKLAFFQLSATSYKSMANMRRVQPRLAALKERYGDDKTRLNQAMMEFYKQEKINPLGGCLPIVVQIPVFIALYWVLLETVELRQSGFIFWIKDLSTYDPYFVLPILMGISMLIQQRLNPAPMDPIQQKVMMVLPVVFTVFFLFFPSGLVLYWFVNNTLSITQQWIITRRLEKIGAK